MISPQESKCTPLGHGKSEYLRLNKEKEKENKDEAAKRGMEELYPKAGYWPKIRILEGNCLV